MYLLFMLFLALGCILGDLTPPKRPNILFMVVDDLRPEIATAYDQKDIITPNLDKLASESLIFDRAYCQVAWCSPSRNSFMTGRYPDTLNIWNFGKNFRTHTGNPPVNGSRIIPLPEFFKDNGYLTLGGGKIYHPGQPPHNDEPYSWSQEVPYFPLIKQDCPKHHKGWPEAVCPTEPQTRPDTWFFDWRLANHTNYLLKFAKQRGGPFFIGAGFRRPHTPWACPQKFWDQYPPTAQFKLAKHQTAPVGMPPIAWTTGPTDGVGRINPYHPLPNQTQQLARHSYYSCVSATDHHIGSVLAELDALELTNSTIVVLFGDHGWQLGEHGEWAKHTNFELATRVPLLVKVPWLPQNAGKHTTAFAELLDLYPTLADLAGLGSSPSGTEGVSLKSVIESGGGGSPRTTSVSQYARCPLIPEKLWDMNTCGSVPDKDITYMGYTIRDDEWRYTQWHKFKGATVQPSCDPLGGIELYSHEGDTGTNFNKFENVNVWNHTGNGPVVKKLSTLLKKQFHKAFSNCYNE